MTQQELHQKALAEPESFWAEQANHVHWFKKPATILSTDSNGFYHWYADGELNTAYLALDYHVENGRAEQEALIYDSPVTNTVKKYTYRELRDEVARFAGVLTSLGVTKGDTVVIYMPMIPEAMIGMLACARIGAIHSVVFGGFAPNELSTRIDDARPKVLLTASCGIEVNRVLPYKPLVDQAIDQAEHKPEKVIIHQRSQHLASMKGERDLHWAALMNRAQPVDCTPCKGTDPLYILYTSGTTGKPKGIVREHGGHAVALSYSMKTVYDTQPGDVFWGASDVGWVVGHSYIVYAPLITGCTTILFEGKPIKTPDAGTFWRIVEDYKVNVLFTAPTAIRAIKKEDGEGEYIKIYNTHSLKYLFLAGERCDIATYQWAAYNLKVPVIDHWWQTESGWPMLANLMGVEPLPVKPGSACKPVPGYDVQILDKSGNAVKANEVGAVVVKLPMPPGCLPTLWNDDERFRAAYLSAYEGYYLSGDGGYTDEDGYFFIMGRIDDVINVAGHRLSTGEMEEVVSSHGAVAECAVIGVSDDLKGQRPVGLVVLKSNVSFSREQLERELVQKVRDKIGPVAYFKTAFIVERLPKTRSGKILRKALRKLADGISFPVPPTIDDPAILDEIRQVITAPKSVE